MRSSRRIVATVVAAGLLIAACGGDDDDAPTADTESTDDGGETTDTTDDGGETTDTTDDGGETTDTTPAGGDLEACTEERRGGEINFAGISLIRALDPSPFIGGGTVGGIELAAIYDVLMRYDPATGEYSPHLAESLTPTDDFTEWTLVLRPEVTFGNGDPLTAPAVQAHIDRMLAATQTNWSVELSKVIESTEVVDDLTLVFTLTDRMPRFEFFLADAPGMVVNTAVAEERGDEFALNPAGAGVGPYEIERFAPGEELVLVPKDDYWGGPVCPEQVRFTSIADPTGNYEAFRNGDINFGLVTRPNVQAEIKDAGENVLPYPTSVGITTEINNGVAGSTPPTTDVRVRRAIQYAFDLELMDDRINDGFGQPTSALVSENSRFYDGQQGLGYDPETAASLVEEVKAETGWDGSISLLCSQQNQEQAVLIQGLLDAVGFQTTVEMVDTADMVARTYGFSGNFELSCSGLAMTDAELPLGGLQGFRSEPPNARGYSSPEMDAALTELSRAETDDEIKAALTTVQQVFNETVPLAVMFAGESDLYWADEVKGLVPHQKIIALLHDAYIEQ